MSKTINQALADLVTGLGESSSVLADNSTVSDYIGDLEDAIKKCAAGEAGDIIDDSAASSTKTYSSNKIAELTAAELPAVTASDNGKALIVSYGAWSKEDIALPTYEFSGSVASETPGTITMTLPTGINRDNLLNKVNDWKKESHFSLNDNALYVRTKLPLYAADMYRGMVWFKGYGTGRTSQKLYEFTIGISSIGAANDVYLYNEVTLS